MSRTKSLAALVALCALTTLPPRLAEAADVTVDVYEGFITSKVDQVVTNYINSRLSRFEWVPGQVHVDVLASGNNSTSVHFVLFLNYDAVIFDRPVKVPALVEADVFLDCGEGGPYAIIDNTRVTTLIPVPQEVTQWIENEANLMLDRKEAEIVGPIWQRLGNLPSIASVRQICPTFTVRANGDIRAELDFVNGCINDRTKHRACGFRQTGPGRDYVCRNGRWYFDWGWCEPLGPPGGDPP